ncbi:MAG: hypothetical protein RLZZ324_1220, partial [Candidatus Parcubacteria bacterium]
MIWMLFSIVILLALCAAFAGTETAIFSLDLIRLRTLSEQKVPGASILEKMRANPKRILGTLLLCNSAVSVAISSITTVIVLQLFNDVYLGIASAGITILIVIFGEYAPKSYAAHNSEKIALLAAYPAYLLTVLCSPIVFVIEGVT